MYCDNHDQIEINRQIDRKTEGTAFLQKRQYNVLQRNILNRDKHRKIANQRGNGTELVQTLLKVAS